MLLFDQNKACALRYDENDRAPLVVASGMGHIAEKIITIAQQNNVPIYQDNSLATLLSQLQTGVEIPEALYRSIVEIYVYFLKFTLGDQSGRAAED